MASQNINLTTLKKHLKQAPKEELIADITELFKKFQPVKEYYQLNLSPETEQQVAASYKKTIENEFFPARGIGNARLSVARKAVMDYKKVCQDPAALVDMMLFYVEQGVQFTTAYGDIDEPFYNSMETMFEKATKTIAQHGLHGIAQRRCRKIVSDTSHMGWGFHDTLSEIYAETFGA
ncbi:MAG: DUF6155 family protein [Thermosynechococcaceae cyanobacterium]